VGVSSVSLIQLPASVVPAALQLTDSHVVFADRASVDDERVGPTSLVRVDIDTGGLSSSSTSTGAGIASLAASGDRIVWVETTPDSGADCQDADYGCFRWRVVSAEGGQAPRVLATSPAAAPARGVPVPRTNRWGTCWASSTDGRSWTSHLEPVDGRTAELAPREVWVRWCEPSSAASALLGEWTVDGGEGRGTIVSADVGAQPILAAKDGVDARVLQSEPLWTMLVDPQNGTRAVRTPSPQAPVLATGEVYLAAWADSHHVVVSSSAGVQLIDVRSGSSVLLTGAADSTAKVAAGGGHVAYVDSTSSREGGPVITVITLGA
jgi:hypothetical protein